MRVVIAEDNTLLREGLAALLGGAGHQVCATVRDGDKLAPALLLHRPDVAVVDIRMPPTYRDEGVRGVAEARRLIPGLPVLFLSQSVDRLVAGELLSNGASGVGYLLKDRVGRIEDFLAALRRVVDGGTALDPEVVGELMAWCRCDQPLELLTPRERQVLALMAEGHHNSGIAERLRLAESSVGKYVGNIFGKLGLGPEEAGHRRVLAVLTYLEAVQPA
ncbi:response regulator transcription factor [Kitasatospora sp. NPDC096077]|uniref:response regulator transcription factor n=1 Tax=Kitasatospora sp. NPDC096077 TaxID=3155544 RepID=UPI003324E4E6